MMSHRRHRQSEFTINDSRRLTFYAALFDTPAEVYDYRPGASERTTYVELIKPGAFRDSLKQGRSVVANVSHRAEQTFARTDDGTLLVQEDPKGLFASCWIPETPLGDSIIRDIGAGLYQGASFKGLFRERTAADGSAEVYSVELEDVCITSMPAYPDTEGQVHLRTKHDPTTSLLARLGLVKIKLKNTR